MINSLHRARSAFRDFLRAEAAGGIILMGAAALALIMANSGLANHYFSLFQLRIGPWDLHHWINDGLMAIFFLMVGLEIKREFVDGHLRDWSDRALPLIAAAGGMAVPALVFLLVTGADPALSRGWAVPAATDIAFAIGVMALLGRHVPSSLKLFLTTVAIADDLGAVLIIALAYTASIKGIALLAAALIFSLMLLINRRGVKALWPYLILALLLWGAVLASGVHATVAGVLAAMAIPITPSPGAPDAADSPLHRLEHALAPWVAYGIVPLFGFANAGVPLLGAEWDKLLSPLTLGIAAGLFVGKQLGIFASIGLAVGLRLGARPQHASWAQLYGVALLCGIGFTMSLFIGGLAFPDAIHMEEVKIGVLAGSILSACAGAIVLLLARNKNPARKIGPDIKY
jgi:Na+:H+ antiporter, NhaA family